MGSLEIELFMSEINFSFHSNLYNCQAPKLRKIKMNEYTNREKKNLCFKLVNFNHPKHIWRQTRITIQHQQSANTKQQLQIQSDGLY